MSADIRLADSLAAFISGGKLYDNSALLAAIKRIEDPRFFGPPTGDDIDRKLAKYCANYLRKCAAANIRREKEKPRPYDARATLTNFDLRNKEKRK